MEELDDFTFYIRFAKPFVLNLPNVNDRVKAAAWIKRLYQDQGDLDIKTKCLKLLLFILQKRQLGGAFAIHPDNYTDLESIPNLENYEAVAREILENGLAEQKNPPMATDYSNDLLEYVSAQEIPNFGVHLYYAFSKDPISAWERTDKAIFAKGPTVEDLSPTAAPSGDGVGENGEDTPATTITTPAQPMRKREKFVAPPMTPLSPVEATPLVDLQRPDEDEEHPAPTWGSYLIGVKDTPILPEDTVKSVKIASAMVAEPFAEHLQRSVEDTNIIEYSDGHSVTKRTTYEAGHDFNVDPMKTQTIHSSLKDSKIARIFDKAAAVAEDRLTEIEDEDVDMDDVDRMLSELENEESLHGEDEVMEDEDGLDYSPETKAVFERFEAHDAMLRQMEEEALADLGEDYVSDDDDNLMLEDSYDEADVTPTKTPTPPRVMPKKATPPKVVPKKATPPKKQAPTYDKPKVGIPVKKGGIPIPQKSVTTSFRKVIPIPAALKPPPKGSFLRKLGEPLASSSKISFTQPPTIEVVPPKKMTPEKPKTPSPIKSTNPRSPYRTREEMVPTLPPISPDAQNIVDEAELEMQTLIKLQDLYDELQPDVRMDMERTPPIFSKHPQIRKLGEQLKYRPDEFELGPDEQYTAGPEFFQAENELGDITPQSPVDQKIYEDYEIMGSSPPTEYSHVVEELDEWLLSKTDERMKSIERRVKKLQDATPGLGGAPITVPKPTTSPRRPQVPRTYELLDEDFDEPVDLPEDYEDLGEMYDAYPVEDEFGLPRLRAHRSPQIDLSHLEAKYLTPESGQAPPLPAPTAPSRPGKPARKVQQQPLKKKGSGRIVPRMTKKTAAMAAKTASKTALIKKEAEAKAAKGKKKSAQVLTVVAAESKKAAAQPVEAPPPPATSEAQKTPRRHRTAEDVAAEQARVAEALRQARATYDRLVDATDRSPSPERPPVPVPQYDYSPERKLQPLQPLEEIDMMGGRARLRPYMFTQELIDEQRVTPPPELYHQLDDSVLTAPKSPLYQSFEQPHWPETEKPVTPPPQFYRQLDESDVPAPESPLRHRFEQPERPKSEIRKQLEAHEMTETFFDPRRPKQRKQLMVGTRTVPLRRHSQASRTLGRLDERQEYTQLHDLPEVAAMGAAQPPQIYEHRSPPKRAPPPPATRQSPPTAPQIDGKEAEYLDMLFNPEQAKFLKEVWKKVQDIEDNMMPTPYHIVPKSPPPPEMGGDGAAKSAGLDAMEDPLMGLDAVDVQEADLMVTPPRKRLPLSLPPSPEADVPDKYVEKFLYGDEMGDDEARGAFYGDVMDDDFLGEMMVEEQAMSPPLDFRDRILKTEHVFSSSPKMQRDETRTLRRRTKDPSPLSPIVEKWEDSPVEDDLNFRRRVARDSGKIRRRLMVVQGKPLERHSYRPYNMPDVEEVLSDEAVDSPVISAPKRATYGDRRTEHASQYVFDARAKERQLQARLGAPLPHLPPRLSPPTPPPPADHASPAPNLMDTDVDACLPPPMEPYYHLLGYESPPKSGATKKQPFVVPDDFYERVMSPIQYETPRTTRPRPAPSTPRQAASKRVPPSIPHADRVHYKEIRTHVPTLGAEPEYVEHEVDWVYPPERTTPTGVYREQRVHSPPTRNGGSPHTKSPSPGTFRRGVEQHAYTPHHGDEDKRYMSTPLRRPKVAVRRGGVSMRHPMQPVQEVDGNGHEPMVVDESLVINVAPTGQISKEHTCRMEDLMATTQKQMDMLYETTPPGRGARGQTARDSRVKSMYHRQAVYPTEDLVEEVDVRTETPTPSPPPPRRSIGGRPQRQAPPDRWSRGSPISDDDLPPELANFRWMDQ